MGDRSQEVAEIYLSEPYGFPANPRVGVVCRQSSALRDEFTSDDIWGKVKLPLRVPPDDVGLSPRLYTQVDLGSSEWFEVCQSESSLDAPCLGVRVLGKNHDHVAGQWRLDKHISRYRPASDLVFVNRVVDGIAQVFLADAGQAIEHVRIEGKIGWWMGFKGNQVHKATE